MDRFQKFLCDIKESDPVIESVEQLYKCLLEENFFRPLKVPDSIRSVTVDPRSGYANKIVPTANGTSAPDYIGDQPNPMSNTHTHRDEGEETKKDWQNPPKFPKISTNMSKQTKALIDRAQDHLPDPVAVTVSHMQQQPQCGYTIKTPVGTPMNGCSTQDGGGEGGGSAQAAS